MTETVDIYIREDCSVLLSRGNERMEFVLSSEEAIKMAYHLNNVGCAKQKLEQPRPAWGLRCGE